MQVGIDIEKVNRFDKFLASEKMLSKIFTQNEQQYALSYKDANIHFCGIYCAKEAVVKALKIGFCGIISPLDIEILHNESKVCYINTDNLKLKKMLNGSKVDISISHTKELATAICVIF